MTFTTVSTIGFGEVKALDTADRLFTMGIAVAGIGALFYTFSVGLDHLTSDAVRSARRRRRMQTRIDKLNGHCVLAGFGRVGREAAHELRQAGTPVVVLDLSAETVATAVNADFLGLAGDATDDQLLQAAGVVRARGLIVTTANDATNLYVILSARLLNPGLFIVSHAVDDATVPKLLPRWSQSRHQPLRHRQATTRPSHSQPACGRLLRDSTSPWPAGAPCCRPRIPIKRRRADGAVVARIGWHGGDRAGGAPGGPRSAITCSRLLAAGRGPRSRPGNRTAGGSHRAHSESSPDEGVRLVLRNAASDGPRQSRLCRRGNCRPRLSPPGRGSSRVARRALGRS